MRFMAQAWGQNRRFSSRHRTCPAAAVAEPPAKNRAFCLRPLGRAEPGASASDERTQCAAHQEGYHAGAAADQHHAQGAAQRVPAGEEAEREPHCEERDQR